MMRSRSIVQAATILFMLISGKNYGQQILDISIGSSNADHLFTGIAYRHQVNEGFRIAIEVMAGQVRYRFIEAKPIWQGYTAMGSLPILYKVYETNFIRLDLYSRLGVRFQFTNDLEDNYQQDEKLSSTAFSVEPGLMVSVPISKKFLIHSGVTIPNFIELSPDFLFENNTSAVTAGFTFRASENTIFLVKGLTGPAMGGDGDTQKYAWSLQAGLRFLIGNAFVGNPMVLESSF